MNICLLSGRLVKNASVRGTEPKVMSFVVETHDGLGDPDKKPRVALVPCVLFNPSAELENLLTTEGADLRVELEGRLNGNAYEARGEQRFSAEVIVRPWTLTVRDSVKPSP